MAEKDKSKYESFKVSGEELLSKVKEIYLSSFGNKLHNYS